MRELKNGVYKILSGDLIKGKHIRVSGALFHFVHKIDGEWEIAPFSHYAPVQEISQKIELEFVSD